MHTGQYPKLSIDHIDQNKLNNTLENLRLASNREQSCNMPIPKTNMSGVVGVHFDKARQKYVAYIHDAGGKRKHLGRSVNFEEAAAMRKEAEKQYGYHENHGKALKCGRILTPPTI